MCNESYSSSDLRLLLLKHYLASNLSCAVDTVILFGYKLILLYSKARGGIMNPFSNTCVYSRVLGRAPIISFPVLTSG